ncbi:helix-turn-helix domain-containing protein [Nocardia cyriacigeorgica]|uniref:helix-turn-helix domain-containing protein n=1 Tax=Nocardia cyriacigeorgica TaxID=135487 RepID=UPI001893E036|nr:helix-turn-helix transcriptional regulator [Nocardia cyriacigeorgica]MBF6102191.1 helix-turn-helix domain-containing protein [Nocardia cyriacigeorgica]
MGKYERDKALEFLLDELTGNAVGERPVLDPEDADAVQSLMEAMGRVADAVGGAAAPLPEVVVPPLEEDPIAARLGLVPDPDYSLDSAALARARKNAGFSAGDLARRLAEREWEVSVADVFRWETRGAPEVSPALIRAIADETGVDSDSLIADQAVAPESDAVAAVMASTDFDELVARWAVSQGTSPALAKTTLKARMLTSVHRGERPDAAQMLHTLAAFVDAHEKDHDG